MDVKQENDPTRDLQLQHDLQESQHVPNVLQQHLPGQAHQQHEDPNPRSEHEAESERASLRQSPKNVNTKQLTQVEREYWQQRLPRGFQFYLERLARGIIRNQPANILEFSTVYLEELLVSRNELWKLPVESYFAKLFRRKMGCSPWQPRRRHLSMERDDTSPCFTQTLPDIVATELLPASSLSSEDFLDPGSSEVRDSDLNRDQGDAFESPEMFTASDCVCKLEAIDNLPDAAQNITASSATFDISSGDGSATSFDVTDDVQTSAACTFSKESGVPAQLCDNHICLTEKLEPRLSSSFFIHECTDEQVNNEAIQKNMMQSEITTMEASVEDGPETHQRLGERLTIESGKPQPMGEMIALSCKKTQPMGEMLALYSEKPQPLEDMLALDSEKSQPMVEILALDSEKSKPMEEMLALDSEKPQPMGEMLALDSDKSQSMKEMLALDSEKPQPMVEILALDSEKSEPMEEMLALDSEKPQPMEEMLALSSERLQPMGGILVLDDETASYADNKLFNSSNIVEGLVMKQKIDKTMDINSIGADPGEKKQDTRCHRLTDVTTAGGFVQICPSQPNTPGSSKVVEISPTLTIQHGASHKTSPSDVSHKIPPNDVSHKIPPNDVSHKIPPNDVSHKIPPNVSHKIPPNDVYHKIPPNDVSHKIPPNDVSHKIPPNDVSHKVPPYQEEGNTVNSLRTPLLEPCDSVAVKDSAGLVTNKGQRLSTTTNMSPEMNPDIEIVSKETNPEIDIGAEENNPEIEIVSKETNPEIDIGAEENNPEIEIVSKETNPEIDIVSEENNQEIEIVSKETNPEIDIVSEENNPEIEIMSKETNPEIDIGAEENNPEIEIVSKETNPEIEIVSKETIPEIDIGAEENNPEIEIVSKETNPEIEIVSKETIPEIEIVSEEMKPEIEIVSKEMKPELEIVSEEMVAEVCPGSQPSQQKAKSSILDNALSGNMAELDAVNSERDFLATPERSKPNTEDKVTEFVMKKMLGQAAVLGYSGRILTHLPKIASDNSVHSESSHGDYDSDTCSPISEIQNEERSQKTDRSWRKHILGEPHTDSRRPVAEFSSNHQHLAGNSRAQDSVVDLADEAIGGVSKLQDQNHTPGLLQVQFGNIPGLEVCPKSGLDGQSQNKNELENNFFPGIVGEISDSTRWKTNLLVAKEKDFKFDVVVDHKDVKIPAWAATGITYRNCKQHGDQQLLSNGIGFFESCADDSQQYIVPTCKFEQYDLQMNMNHGTNEVAGENCDCGNRDSIQINCLSNNPELQVLEQTFSPQCVHITERQDGHRCHGNAGVETERKQPCPHASGPSKHRMEKALSMARNYVSELENATLEIEKIVERHFLATLEETFFIGSESDNPTEYLQAAIAEALKDTGAESETKFKVDEHVENKPKSLNCEGKLEVSRSLLDQASQKVVDICSGTYGWSDFEQDSRICDFEYRVGNVVFKINCVQYAAMESEPLSFAGYFEEMISCHESGSEDKSLALASDMGSNTQVKMGEMSVGSLENPLAPLEAQSRNNSNSVFQGSSGSSSSIVITKNNSNSNHNLNCNNHNLSCNDHNLNCTNYNLSSNNHNLNCNDHNLNCNNHNLSSNDHNLNCNNHKCTYHNDIFSNYHIESSSSNYCTIPGCYMHCNILNTCVEMSGLGQSQYGVRYEMFTTATTSAKNDVDDKRRHGDTNNNGNAVAPEPKQLVISDQSPVAAQSPVPAVVENVDVVNQQQKQTTPPTDIGEGRKKQMTIKGNRVVSREDASPDKVTQEKGSAQDTPPTAEQRKGCVGNGAATGAPRSRCTESSRECPTRCGEIGRLNKMKNAQAAKPALGPCVIKAGPSDESAVKGEPPLEEVHPTKEEPRCPEKARMCRRGPGGMKCKSGRVENLEIYSEVPTPTLDASKDNNSVNNGWKRSAICSWHMLKQKRELMKNEVKSKKETNKTMPKWKCANDDGQIAGKPTETGAQKNAAGSGSDQCVPMERRCRSVTSGRSKRCNKKTHAADDSQDNPTEDSEETGSPSNVSNVARFNKSMFPLRVRATDKEASVQSVPSLSRRLTVESPNDNLLVHSSFLRPNSWQAEMSRNFEVSSLKKRLYVEDNEAGEQTGRRLICETECFSSVNPVTKNLVIENGTSSGKHAAVKVLVGNGFSRKRQESARANRGRQDGSGKDGDEADSDETVPLRHRYLKKIGNYVIIGNPQTASSIEQLVYTQQSRSPASDRISNRSSNALLMATNGDEVWPVHAKESIVDILRVIS